MIQSILVIEDSLDLRNTVMEFFTHAGFEVNGAENGLAGLNYLKERFSPDLILLDMQMPILNGYDFLKQKELLCEIKHIPVIVFSAEPGIDSLRGQAGVIHTTSKCTELSDLLMIIRHMESSRHCF